NLHSSLCRAQFARTGALDGGTSGHRHQRRLCGTRTRTAGIGRSLASERTRPSPARGSVGASVRAFSGRPRQGRLTRSVSTSRAQWRDAFFAKGSTMAKRKSSVWITLLTSGVAVAVLTFALNKSWDVFHHRAIGPKYVQTSLRFEDGKILLFVRNNSDD